MVYHGMKTYEPFRHAGGYEGNSSIWSTLVEALQGHSWRCAQGEVAVAFCCMLLLHCVDVRWFSDGYVAATPVLLFNATRQTGMTLESECLDLTMCFTRSFRLHVSIFFMTVKWEKQSADFSCNMQVAKIYQDFKSIQKLSINKCRHCRKRFIRSIFRLLL